MLRISIGVSRCLVGDSVRYDGAHKYSKVCCETLAKHFELMTVCPEVDSGLSVPRPPIELVLLNNELRALGRDNASLDVTEQLRHHCQQQMAALSSLAGFVVTTKSPSCGYQSVAIKSKSAALLSGTGNGLFVTSLLKHFPLLPIIEEQSLQSEHAVVLFQLRVTLYALIQHKTVLRMNHSIDHHCDEFLMAINEAAFENKMAMTNVLLDDMDSALYTSLLIYLRENFNVR